MSKSPKASLIIAVYNQWPWLHLILEALSMQTESDFETIIADDGSNPETIARIKQYIETHPDRHITHLWHEDKGWRKNIMLNKAVVASRADLLIFIDGDCVPHPRFVADHIALSRRGVINSGRRFDLPQPVSDWLVSHPLEKGYYAKTRWQAVRYYFNHGFKSALRPIRRSMRLPLIFGHSMVPLPDAGILGCNFSIFKDDILEVNGFDERYVNPGTGEDTDLAERLLNAGKTIHRISRYALQLHRCHKHFDLNNAENHNMLQEAINNKTTYTPYGINKTR